MKTFKQTMSAVLALSMMLGIAGCNKQKLSHEGLVKVAKDMGLEELSFAEDYTEALQQFNGEYSVYYSTTDLEEAQYLYDNDVNGLYMFDFRHTSEFTALCESDIDGYNHIWLITFTYPDDAEKFYDQYSELLVDEGKSGNAKGYEYAISTYELEDSDEVLFDGVYLADNMVLVIRSTTEDSGFVTDFCKKMKIVSPTEA